MSEHHDIAYLRSFYEYVKQYDKGHGQDIVRNFHRYLELKKIEEARKAHEMNKQSIFENRKARLLREFQKTFPGQTPPTTDEEVEYWLEEEQFVTKQWLIASYKRKQPELNWPETREEIEQYFNNRDLFHEVNWAYKSGKYDRLDSYGYIAEKRKELMQAKPEWFVGKSDEEAKEIFVNAYMLAFSERNGGAA